MKYIYLRYMFIVLVIPALHGCAAVVVGGAATATGVGVAVSPRTVGTFVEDEAIELKALKGFYADKDIRAQAHINVTSYNNIVLVTGEAPTEEIRARVIGIVRNIAKVRHVHNEVTIAAPSALISRSSDTVVTGKVKSKILAREKLGGLNIKVVTEKGVVYLMGVVNRTQADDATEIARKTGGVQKVVKLFEYTDAE